MIWKKNYYGAEWKGYETIPLLNSVNPLDCGLWPKAVIEKIHKTRKKSQHQAYLQMGGWDGFGQTSNPLPCVIREDGHKYSIDMGNGDDGELKTSRQQYPNTFGIGAHKLTALVSIFNPSPDELTEVDHINDVNDKATVHYASLLHRMFGYCCPCKVLWAKFNLKWSSSSDNGADARNDAHKQFKKMVPFSNLESEYAKLSEQELRQKSGFEILNDLRNKNEWREGNGWDDLEDQAYYGPLYDFIDNPRMYNKEEYWYMIYHVCGFADEVLLKLPDSILRDVDRYQKWWEKD
tara:strand:+ start:1944 stop:2819 length:876 start_codon:yes stop_codon:yes gene_type:complete